MKHNILKDVSAMTNIPQTILRSIASIEEHTIADSVRSVKHSDLDRGDIDLGFGTLSFILMEDGVKFRFQPSKNLATMIQKTVFDDIPITEIKVEQELARRIKEVYKELFDGGRID